MLLLSHAACVRGVCYYTRRGIDVVRNKIKMFAQKKVTLPPGRHKIVILDEADRSDIPVEGRGVAGRQQTNSPSTGQAANANRGQQRQLQQGERSEPQPCERHNAVLWQRGDMYLCACWCVPRAA